VTISRLCLGRARQFFSVTTVAERGIHHSLVVSGRVVFASNQVRSRQGRLKLRHVASRRIKAGKGAP
jgi:hypothetical protein